MSDYEDSNEAENPSISADPTPSDTSDEPQIAIPVQFFTPLPERGVISISGADARKFLQNILTNDIEKVSSEMSIYSILLTPQGKFLYDFFICQVGENKESFLLDSKADVIPEIIAKFEEYKLRSAVEIEDVSDIFGVAAVYGELVIPFVDPEGKPGATKEVSGAYFYIDPRTPNMHVRVICGVEAIPDTFMENGLLYSPREEYEYLRIWVGVPDPDRDMEEGNAFPLDYGFAEMGAIDFEKGCYIGQEVTTRTYRRGNLKKQLYPVFLEGELPADGTDIMANKKRIGNFSSGIANIGLAMMYKEDVEFVQSAKSPITCGNARLRIDKGTTLGEHFQKLKEEAGE